MQTPSDNGGGMRDELRSVAQQMSKSATNRIHSELDARKGTATDQAKSVSSAIDRAAGELDEAPQWLQSAFRQGATQVRRFADTLEQKDSRQILSDVRNMARENPGTFLAGCAALGFAAARVFKAGASDQQQPRSQQPSFPPAQVNEPMFRPASDSTSPSPRGEFA